MHNGYHRLQMHSSTTHERWQRGASCRIFKDALHVHILEAAPMLRICTIQGHAHVSHMMLLKGAE
jgi:hypothetical protein